MNYRAKILAASAVLCFFLSPGSVVAESADDLGLAPIPQPPSRGHVVALKQIPSTAGQVANKAAGWLIAQANPDGAFPWTAGTLAAPNTQGATALGLLRAFDRNGVQAHLDAAIANGNCQVASCVAGMTFADGDHRFAAHDPLFLVELTESTGDPVYAAFVKTWMWDKFASASYGAGNNLDAAGYAQALLAARTSGGFAELVSWDLSKLVIAAHRAGEFGTRDAAMQRVLASLEATTGGAFTSVDVIGLAGAIWTSALTGIELDPAAGRWAGADSTAQLADLLRLYQTPGGGFVTSSVTALQDTNASAQTTAFAMQALHAVDPVAHADAINAGFGFLVSLQQANGQFLSSMNALPTSGGGIEVHGETLEAYAVARLGEDRHVAESGTDIGDCSQPQLPCRTIQYAVDQANEGNTIRIQSGTYVDPVLIRTAGLRLLGEGPTRPVLDRTSGATNQSLLVIRATGIEIDNLQFNADRSYVAEGVLCVANCVVLDVRNSLFLQRRSTAVSSTYGRTNAISAGITVAGYPGPTGPIALTVQDTTIGIDTLSAIATAFRAGIALDRGFGQLGGIGAGNDIVATNHDIIVRESRGGDVLIEGNTLRGFGVQLTTPQASTTALSIRGNVFAPAQPPVTPAAFGDFSAMRLISNPAGVPLSISDNDFAGHERGILIQNFPGVTLDNNNFTPRDGSAHFQHVVVSNKELFSNATPPVPLAQALSLIARGNTFNAGDVSGFGTAISFLNDNAQGEPVGGYFGPIVFGGPAIDQANDFVGAFGRVFELGGFDCVSSNAAPCPLAALYSSVSGAMPGTPVLKFAGNVSAALNRFNGAATADMNIAQRNALLARTQDSASDPALGTVDYGFAADQTDVFVDDDYQGLPYGHEVAFSHPDPIANGQTAYIGINAFATIPAGAAAAASGGAVYVAAGSYAGATIDRTMRVLGAGSTDLDPVASSVILGGVVVSAGGVDAGNPTLLSGLRVQNSAGDGIRLLGSLDHVSLIAIDSSGNLGNGMQAFAANGAAPSITRNLLIADSRFDDNGVAMPTLSQLVGGALFDENASVDGLRIERSSFNGNNGVGLSFNDIGAPGSTSTIRNVVIEDSQFNRNNPADQGPAGGGIWLKTSGAGSLIENVSITGSEFIDNGTGQTNTLPQLPARKLNANGITVRARPGTSLSNVTICANTFADTAAASTQIFGILVFDDTANNGYSPLVVCASNVFTGMEHSVSGYEQRGARGTQPVVVVTGGTIAGVEYINEPVRNADTGKTFATILAAMQDGDTAASHTILVGVGVYREGVVIPYPQMTLAGADALDSVSVIEGVGISGSGIAIPTGRDGTTIRDLTVRDFTAMNNSQACVFADRVNDITVENLTVSNCQGGRAGIYANGLGGIDNVVLRGNEVTNVGPGGARGIVIWNGFKTNITIEDNYVHDIAGCCGIELQDGTASGVQVIGNRVERAGDNGIGLIGLMGGAGANRVADNIIIDSGRFGIEVKLANGSGLDTGDGSIVVEDNEVSQSNSFAVLRPSERRDIAGIAVYRRGLVASENNVDIPAGVIVRNNTISGFAQNNPASQSDGFGIVLEGLAMSATGNTLIGNDVGIQRQRGHLPYSAGTNVDGDQADLDDDYFGRGNSPQTCALVDGNTYDGNATDLRDIGGAVGVSAINLDTGAQFCGIQLAINDAATLAGHTIAVQPGIHAENIQLTKSVILQGPFAGIRGDDPLRDGSGEAVLSPPTGIALRMGAPNATVDGITIANTTGVAVQPNGSSRDDMQFINNRVLDIGTGVGIRFEPGEGSPASGFTVSRNLFRNIRGTGLNGAGVQLFKGNRNAVVTDNLFDGMQNQSIQINGGNGEVIGAFVSGNIAADSGALGTGTAYVLTNTTDVVFTDNRADGTSGGLFISDRTSNLLATCNALSVTSNALSSADFFGGAPNSNIRIFHNVFSGATDVRNGMAQGWTIGSNWYGGDPAVANDVAGGLLLADPLTISPIGNAACGVNTMAGLTAYNGTPQSTAIGTLFTTPLQARVVDAFGGAVAGEAVTFAAPASGSSASLDPAGGTSDFNGVVATLASANLLAGSYQVDALAGAFPAAFALTNGKGAGTVVWGALTLTYNGQPQSPTAAVAEDPSAICSVSATAAADVGDYSVTATCEGDNYIASATTTASIIAKAVTIVLDGLGSFPYDGNPRSVAASVDGLEGADTIALAVTYNGAAAAPTDVGSYIVIAAFDPDAPAVINYVAMPAIGSLIITKAMSTVTIEAGDLQQQFGATRAVAASASPLSPAPATGSVLVTYDGNAAVPTAVGTYSVLAVVDDPNYQGVASATLVVSDSAAITLELLPVTAMALVDPLTSYTDFVDFAGSIDNTGEITAQPVHTRITVVRIDDGNAFGGQPVAIALDDVKACVFDSSGWAAQAPEHDGCEQDFQWLFKSAGALNGRASVVLRYPNLPANDQPLPNTGEPMPLPPSNLRFRTGEYRVQIDIVGSLDGTVYATASTNTTTVPDAAIAYSGATSGPAEDLLLSTTTLLNAGGRVDGNVIVRITLSDAAATVGNPIALDAADAELFYQDGADYLTLPWLDSADDGGLVTWFGPDNGFPLEDGYAATTAGAGLFHRTGQYRLRYEVLDVATLDTVFASDEVQLLIDPNAVNFALGDLTQVYDGTPRAVTVFPADVPRTIEYEALDGASCPAAPVAGSSTAPIDAGHYCVYVNATGAFTGSASGLLVVTRALAGVSIDDAIAGVVSRVFDGNAQVVAASTPAVLSGTVSVTYSGAAQAPSAAGSYTLLASIVDPNHVGFAAGLLVIGTDGGATILLDDDDGTGQIVRTFNGGPQSVTATTTPVIDYTVSYVGTGATVYPATATAPSNAGSYAVVATTDDPNYAAVSASGTLVIERASAVIQIDALEQVFDGSGKAVTVTVDPAVAFTVTYGGSSVLPINAGSYPVQVDIVDPNHVGSAQATLVISPAAVTVAFANLAHVYDGNAKAASASTMPSGVAVELGYSQDAVQVSPINAGSYLVTATVSNPNYQLSGADTAELVIDKAVAQVTLSNLTQVFDGTGKAVTVATSPASLAVNVSYDGSPILPIGVGSYPVMAIVESPNHQGSAAGTLNILAAAIAGFTVVGPTEFDGIAGASLTGDLPTVRVIDTDGQGVSGISVRFAVVAGSIGNGTGVEVATTDIDGHASVSGWTLSADAGATLMTANVLGLAGLPTRQFTANGAEQADLAVLKSSVQTDVTRGELVDYTIVVTNAGPSNAQDVSILDLLPDGLDAGTAVWMCEALDGASCQTADGDGDVDVDASVPVGASVTVVLTVAVAQDAAPVAVNNTAAVVLNSGIDPNSGNNESTHSLTVGEEGGTPDGAFIFRNGFEAAN